MKILVNGASWTTGSNLPNNFNWSHSLAAKGYEVINLAQDGISVGSVLRSTIEYLYANHCDYIAMVLPCITTRREMIVVDNEDKKRFLNINYSLIKNNVHLDSSALRAIMKFIGLVVTDEDDIIRTLQDIHHLCLFLKSTNTPFHIELDNPFYQIDQYSIGVVDLIARPIIDSLVQQIEPFLSLQQGLINTFLQSHELDSDEHPTKEGHLRIGELFCQKLNL
jgi:hypothetical protein